MRSIVVTVGRGEFAGTMAAMRSWLDRNGDPIVRFKTVSQDGRILIRFGFAAEGLAEACKQQFGGRSAVERRMMAAPPPCPTITGPISPSAIKRGYHPILSILVAAIASFGILLSGSRAEPPALGLVESLKIKIDELDADAKKCGLSRTKIFSVLRSCLSSGGLMVMSPESTSDALLNVQPLTIIIDGDRCVTSYSMDLIGFPLATFHGVASREAALFWSSAGIFLSKIDNHQNQIELALTNECGKLINSWNIAR